MMTLINGITKQFTLSHVNRDCHSGLDPESICRMDSRLRGNDTAGMASVLCKQITALVNITEHCFSLVTDHCREAAKPWTLSKPF